MSAQQILQERQNIMNSRMRENRMNDDVDVKRISASKPRTTLRFYIPQTQHSIPMSLFLCYQLFTIASYSPFCKCPPRRHSPAKIA